MTDHLEQARAKQVAASIAAYLENEGSGANDPLSRRQSAQALVAALESTQPVLRPFIDALVAYEAAVARTALAQEHKVPRTVITAAQHEESVALLAMEAARKDLEAAADHRPIVTAYGALSSIVGDPLPGEHHRSS